jgi:pantoate--beta-alanine ligase
LCAERGKPIAGDGTNFHQHIDAAAAFLYQALRAIQRRFCDGESAPEALLQAGKSVLEQAGIHPEYLEIRDAITLMPVLRGDIGALVAIAAHIGTTRLIDNIVLAATRPE